MMAKARDGSDFDFDARCRHITAMSRLGAKDGRAWAESGRSYYAVEAAYLYFETPDEDEAEKDKLKAAMFKAIGDDDECPLVAGSPATDKTADKVYVNAWFDAVREVFEEMREAV
jgi:hypothetical protein